jgi:uncharacterized membrane protein
MSTSPDQKGPARGTSRVPHSFFYDRVIPILLIILAVVLAVVVILVIGALTGLVPVR